MMNQTESTNRCPKCGAAVPADAPQGLCPKCVFAGLAAPPLTGGATATAEIPSLERVAAAFPQLEVAELVGRGGMGFVFKARQPHLDRWVALKLLPDKLARDPQFAERFNREGRVLAKLNHPNIVSVFDFGQTPDFYYLLMEYVDGVNLRQAMQAGRFSPAEALTIVPKICEALQYAHEQGVLHRDIKPENILLDAKGRVKIADFGIAKLVGEVKPEVTLTGTGAALGTLHYMAPEQLETPAKVDHRADIYSLGVVFYEMLTGELPIGRFAPPSERTPVDAKVDEVVFRALEKDRDKRFQSAGEVKQTVEHLTSSGAAIATPSGASSLLKETRCHIGTLEHARSIVGRYVSVYQGVGQLRLFADRLVYDGGVNRVQIPLNGIRALGTGRYSAWTKPAGLDFLAITFTEAGELRTLLFTLNPSRTTTAWETNQLTAEWRQAIGEAVRAVTGQLPPEPPAELLHMPGSRFASRYLWLITTLLACSAVPIVFQSWLKGRPPGGYIEDALPYLLALVPGAAMVAWLFWRQRRAARKVFLQPPLVGPHGTIVASPSRFSAKAIWGAVLTGLAWLLVGAPLALTLAGGGGLGKWELLLFLLPGCLCGLAGTILGWVALSDIRAASGRLRGLPLAVFAALACPLLLLVGVTLAVPTYVVTTAQPGLVVRALALAIPAGVLTFSIWAVYATVRWAGNRPPGRRRGILKWVFLALAAGGIAVMALNYRPVGSTWQTAAAIPPVNNPALRLPTGMIELVALARHPADGLWWQPDGSVRPEAPFETAGAPEPPSRGGQAVELVFRTQGLPADASGPRLIFDRGLGFSGGGHPRLQGREAPDHSVYTVAFPEGVKTTTVYAGIGYGPWVTLAEDYRTAGSSADVPHGGERWRIAFRGALEDKEGDVVVSVNFSHSARNEFEEVRLVAVTAEGREIPASSSTKTRDHLQATFSQLPLTSVEHFRFQVRPLRWAEFKHVRLMPDNPR